MAKFNRDIIILVKDDAARDEQIEAEVKKLHEMIASVENRDVFCNAHELVARNKITRKKFRIMDAVSTATLRPFYFLINKN